MKWNSIAKKYIPTNHEWPSMERTHPTQNNTMARLDPRQRAANRQSTTRAIRPLMVYDFKLSRRFGLPGHPSWRLKYELNPQPSHHLSRLTLKHVCKEAKLTPPIQKVHQFLLDLRGAALGDAHISPLNSTIINHPMLYMIKQNASGSTLCC